MKKYIKIFIIGAFIALATGGIEHGQVHLYEPGVPHVHENGVIHVH